MKIDVKFPQIMKMEMTARVEISDTDTLEMVKEKSLNIFWQVFTKKIYAPAMGIHGTTKDVTFKVGTVVIQGDDDFRARLKQSTSFEVVFKTH